jgi:hypothetical protein
MVTKAAIFVFVVIAITMFTVISVKAQLATVRARGREGVGGWEAWGGRRGGGRA